VLDAPGGTTLDCFDLVVTQQGGDVERDTIDEAVHSIEQRLGNLLVGELPDDGAEFVLGRETQAVVDTPYLGWQQSSVVSVALGDKNAVPTLAVGVVTETPSS
jgi:hypothetical protein